MSPNLKEHLGTVVLWVVIITFLVLAGLSMWAGLKLI